MSACIENKHTKTVKTVLLNTGSHILHLNTSIQYLQCLFMCKWKFAPFLFPHTWETVTYQKVQYLKAVLKINLAAIYIPVLETGRHWRVHCIHIAHVFRVLPVKIGFKLKAKNWWALHSKDQWCIRHATCEFKSPIFMGFVLLCHTLLHYLYAINSTHLWIIQGLATLNMILTRN